MYGLDKVIAVASYLLRQVTGVACFMYEDINMFKNDKLKSALRKELSTLATLMAAVAVLAYLTGMIGATPAGLLLSLSFVSTGYVILKSEDMIEELVLNLVKFREMHTGAMLLAWATGSLAFNGGFVVMGVLYIIALVIELALRADT